MTSLTSLVVQAGASNLPDFPAMLELALRLGTAAGLLYVALLLALRFLRVVTDDPPRIENHYGGFGGGLAGWRVSPSLAYLVAALLFGAMATMLLTPRDGRDGEKKTSSTQERAQAAEVPNDSAGAASSTNSAKIDSAKNDSAKTDSTSKP